MITINPELLSTKPTHTDGTTFYKVFTDTVSGDYATAEIMNGENKGKWTTVNVKSLDAC